MKNILCACVFLLLTVSAYPQQTLVTNRNVFENHGGWGLLTTTGNDEGDTISFSVTCDHPVNGQCLVAPPTIANGSLFELVPSKSHDGHQLYRAQVICTGEQVITANYWWIGTQVHYHIVIVASERFEGTLGTGPKGRLCGKN